MIKWNSLRWWSIKFYDLFLFLLFRSSVFSFTVIEFHLTCHQETEPQRRLPLIAKNIKIYWINYKSSIRCKNAQFFHKIQWRIQLNGYQRRLRATRTHKICPNRWILHNSYWLHTDLEGKPKIFVLILTVIIIIIVQAVKCWYCPKMFFRI